MPRALAFYLSLIVAGLALVPAAEAGSGGSSITRAVVREVNRARARHHLPAVHSDARLARVARGHSRVMARHRFFAHDSRNGVPWYRRVARAARTPNVGEVLGYLQDVALRREAATVVRAWMKSPEHRVVLLARRYRRIGVGRAWAHWDGRRTAIFTADLAVR